MAFDLECAPYALPAKRGTSILSLASRASRASEAYQRAIDDRCDYRTMLRVSGALARATAELTSAIADSVASGDGRITDDVTSVDISE